MSPVSRADADAFNQINKIICHFVSDECESRDCHDCEGDGIIAKKTNRILALVKSWERGADVGP